MKEYAPDAIRNVVLASHSASGKTTLTEACLYLTGTTTRMGRVEEGNTVSDYLPEEVKRRGSIWASALAFEHENTKFNFLDTPGYADFFGEVCAAMSAAENVLLVANATTDLEIGLEAAAKRARAKGLACFVFINQMERERAAFDPLFDALHSRLHLPVVALTYPIGQEHSFKGYIDVVEQKAYEDNGGKLTEVPIPDESVERVKQLRDALVEAAVECDDDLMMKYLDGEELGADEIRGLLCKAVAQNCVVPVLCGSATKLMGVSKLLATLRQCAVSPATTLRNAVGPEGNEITVPADPAAPFSGFVFKTFSDPTTGRSTFIKIVAGTLRRDADVINLDRGHHERLAHLLVPLGKKHTEIEVAHAGDIVLVLKLRGTTTGNSLSAVSNGPRYPRPDLPESLYGRAVEPLTHGDDDKLNEALHRLTEEDQTFKVARHPDTGQTLIYGLGDIHLATIIARLKSAFGVDVKDYDPKVPYRETIRKPVKYEGKLKKQSGGHGQFADVWLEIEPTPPGGGFEFVDKIVGGVVPRSFIPAVEEGVRDALKAGPLAGYPLVDLKVTLYDGKYHDVDSSYQTFKVAGSLGLRGGTKEASPVLLEPIVEATIEVPEDAAGDVVGDLNSRRGHILGMEPTGSGTVQVKAYIPEAEMIKYPITLRSITRGRGRFTKQFAHYSPVAENIA
ncbi:MAG: elongation factor G, partial [Armatimonadota bacterium]|nr:elongation factor G [Armatimonadota bacterium]